MTRWTDALKVKREQAVDDAAEVLTQCGFDSRSRMEWLGHLGLPDNRVAIRIELPPEFPDKLPEIFLQNPTEVDTQSHIESSGKICIAPTSGNLLDFDRPSAIVLESLEKAKTVLEAPAKDQARDIQLEIVAYWPDKDSASNIWSLIAPSEDGREIAFSTIQLNGTYTLFAENDKSLKQWAHKVGANYGDISKSYLLVLKSLPSPPNFDEKLTTAEFEAMLQKNMDEDKYNQWRKWDGNRRPPPVILVTCKLTDGSSTFLAIRTAQLSESQERAIQNPYRRKPPATKIVRAALQENPIGRRAVTRLDLMHLLNRTAGSSEFDEARIAVIGCGALGSQIAVASAASGVQLLTLVDSELLDAENIHRHALGAKDLKRSKVKALAKHIEERFPHIEVTACFGRFEDVVDNSPDILDEIDLCIFALGDETLERRINAFLGASTIRLHAWIEPYGIGGHVLVIPGGEQKGCFECLYARDEHGTLYNMSSLCAPGQVFQRTTGGCAGTFTPFGYLDTLETAAETVRQLSRLSSEIEVSSGLISWVGDEGPYLSAGFKLSKRGQALLKIRKVHRTDIWRKDCRICSKW